MDITFDQRRADFLNLDCNVQYSFSLRFSVEASTGSIRTYSSSFPTLFYGSKLKSVAVL